MNTLKTIIKNNLVGTSFHGDTIKANCIELEKVFGEYNTYVDDKVTFEWNLLIKEDNIPFSIYNWKEPWLDEYMVTNYHIGARTPEESKIVKDLVDMYLKNNKQVGINN